MIFPYLPVVLQCKPIKEDDMRISSSLLSGVGTFSAAMLVSSGLAYAGCTANLTADRELNVRSGPSTNYQPVGKIPGQACRIRIGNCDDGWCKVDYRGISGFSSEFYLQRTAGGGGNREQAENDQQLLNKWLDIAQSVFAQLQDDPDWENLGSVEVGRDRDRSVIQLDRSDGRFDALRMRVRGSDVNFRRVVVVYGNGKRHNLDFNRVLDAGEESGEIALRGQQGRFINRIILVHEKAQRRGRPAEVQVWAHKTAEGRAERPGRPDRPNFGPNWKRVASKEVDRRRDREVIQLGRNDGRFDEFRLRVLNNDVRIRRMNVQYGNGTAHDLDVDRRVNEGEATDPITLRGRNGRFIDRVTLVYDTVGRGPKATVELWAHQTEGRQGRNDRPNFGRNWDRLASKEVDRRRDRDVIQLDRKDGRFDEFRLRVLDNDLRIRRMRVEYGNGVAHDLDVDRRVNEGEATDPITLRGRNGRFIDRVTLVYDTVGRGQKATVELWGRKTN
jgi:uncharacterized protein YraI